MKPFQNIFAASLLLLGCVASGCSAFTPRLHRTAVALSKASHEFPSSRQQRCDTRQLTHVCLNTQNDEGPDPSVLIAAKDDMTQQVAVAAAFAALAVGTTACITLWHGPGAALLGPEGFETIRGTVFPIAFGTIFAVVGVLHFVFVDNFAAIVPPRGTWGGLWQVPAPFAEELGVTYEEYHAYWSGIAEFVGGLYLLAGGLGLTDNTQLPAVLLFLLTVGVTPANLFMFTHDAHPGGNVPKLAYPAGHIARFVLQCGLLSNFWIMAFA